MRYCNTENTVCEYDIEHIVTLQVSVGVVMAFLYRNSTKRAILGANFFETLSEKKWVRKFIFLKVAVVLERNNAVCHFLTKKKLTRKFRKMTPQKGPKLTTPKRAKKALKTRFGAKISRK